MVKVAVVGGRGYMGGEALRLLFAHPDVQVTEVTSRTDAGRRVDDVFPHLDSEMVFSTFDAEKITADIVILGLPHKVSMSVAGQFLRLGKKVIDLSGDFRLDEAAVYQKWYKAEHTDPGLLKDAVYGLPELNREHIKTAHLVASPGCYPTSIILGAAPFYKLAYESIEGVIANSVSGISGAGRQPSDSFHFPAMNENMFGYNPFAHRHTPEIIQELGKLCSKQPNLTFFPHVGPFTRGIYSTIYFYGTSRFTQEQIRDAYHEFYDGEPLVRILKAGELPRLKAVSSSCRCDIGISMGDRDTAIVVSAIDNLLKGGAAQAVQSMNIMSGLPETKGLLASPAYP